jgi:hypothetical protein
MAGGYIEVDVKKCTNSEQRSSKQQLKHESVPEPSDLKTRETELKPRWVEGETSTIKGDV